MDTGTRFIPLLDRALQTTQISTRLREITGLDIFRLTTIQHGPMRRLIVAR